MLFEGQLYSVSLLLSLLRITAGMTATIYCALTVYQILGRDFIHVTTNFDNTPKLNIVNTTLHVRKQSLRDFCDIRNYIALQN